MLKWYYYYQIQTSQATRFRTGGAERDEFPNSLPRMEGNEESSSGGGQHIIKQPMLYISMRVCVCVEQQSGSSLK